MVDFTDGKTAGSITRPWYVIDVRLGQQMYHFSNANAADWDGREYLSGFITPDGVLVDEASARIRLSNDDYRWTAQGIRGELHGGELRVWYVPRAADTFRRFYPKGYVKEGYEQGDRTEEPRLAFAGKITEVPEIGTSIRLVSSRKNIGGFPSMKIMPPLANHTAPEGSKITYHNRIYIVDKR